jgi:MFS family permease
MDHAQGRNGSGQSSRRSKVAVGAHRIGLSYTPIGTRHTARWMVNLISHPMRRDYWQFNLATFLCFCSMSQLTLLSVILSGTGLSANTIGNILSSFAAAIIIATVASGWLITRAGALPVAVLGLLIMLLSFVSMQWTIMAPILMWLSRCLQGVGFGLFLPAGTLYVKGITDKQEGYYIGLFVSMVTIPTLFAPTVAEWYLGAYGVGQFFLVMSIPIVVSILLAGDLLRRDPRIVTVPVTKGYLTLLRDLRLLSQLSVVLVQGCFWGFVTAFLSLLLHKANVPVGAFFTPLAAALLISRFWLMRYVERYDPTAVSIAAVLSMVTAHISLLAPPNIWLTGAAGILFGWGYSVVYPMAVVAIAAQYEPDQRAKPVALVSMVFHLGYFVTPLFGGYIIAGFGFDMLIVLLCALALLLLAGQRALLRLGADT